MAPLLALLPSPLLGPAVWQPVAQLLTGLGWPCVTPGQPAPPRTGQDVLDAYVGVLPTETDLVLVPHSNAGAYVPALTTQRRVAAAVFVDAVLPPEQGSVQLAPPALLRCLREKVDSDGLLPPWTGWWDEAEVASLFPDPSTRAQVEREQGRLPLSYFEGAVSVPPGWDARPTAYLAFGDTYAAERARAEQWRWPVRSLPAGHLHMLVDPEQVATELVALMSRLGLRSSGD